MYAYIRGTIKDIKPTHIVLESNSIGYKIIVSNPYQYSREEECTVHTYHHVREDVFALYGFKSHDAKILFERLLTVSGIGPKSALSILATEDINEVIIAIENSDVKFLTRFPGIGMKSAQQIILDLKGKLVEDEGPNTKEASETEQALLALGYKKAEIRRTLKKIDDTKPVEEMVKEALKLLIK